MKKSLVSALALVAGLGVAAANAQPSTARYAEMETHRAAAKAAALTDFDGTLGTTCIAVDAPRGAPPDSGRGPVRSSWYAKPYKVFDNLYWVGTQFHSSWALKTSAGIILIDTLFNYASEPEIVDGLKTLGLDPKTIKYVIISHGHGDHDEGARMLQDRFGAKVVMGAEDWDLEARSTNKPGGVPKKDIVGEDGQKITLGDTTVTLVKTPGHTFGTLSMIFQVKDRGRPLTVAYSGGTAFNFPHTLANYDMYINSQRKLARAAASAGATILMSNHSQFDDAYDRVRVAQLPRKAGEPHPYEIGAETVGRYFKMTEECAQAGKLAVNP
ncbi:MAG: MBL fold metallo-hydrolase [Caulobacteraceae bacterium]